MMVQTFKVLSESFKGIGHPSIEPGGRYVMTDHREFHPDGSATTSLLLLGSKNRPD